MYTPHEQREEEGDDRDGVAHGRCHGRRGVLEAAVVQAHAQCIPTKSVQSICF
jgi:hypothetical protein